MENEHITSTTKKHEELTDKTNTQNTRKKEQITNETNAT